RDRAEMRWMAHEISLALHRADEAAAPTPSSPSTSRKRCRTRLPSPLRPITVSYRRGDRRRAGRFEALCRMKHMLNLPLGLRLALIALLAISASACQKKKPKVDFWQELPPGQMALRKIQPGEYPD